MRGHGAVLQAAQQMAKNRSNHRIEILREHPIQLGGYVDRGARNADHVPGGEECIREGGHDLQLGLREQGVPRRRGRQVRKHPTGASEGGACGGGGEELAARDGHGVKILTGRSNRYWLDAKSFTHHA
ncbi:hypothetical protein LBMAG42_18060 [Deltaproteobacteria bacterium]|nr:hypothetical protein LBMAG42_18060 [Deltaproteobacteria bacterium]